MVALVTALKKHLLALTGFGMYSCFVGEGAEAGDRIVERNIDFYCCSNQVLNILELLKLILALDVITIGWERVSYCCSVA